MPWRVAFTVTGDLPPKKDGGASMWLKRAEVPRLVRLRRAAHDALYGRPAYDGPVQMRIVIRCPDPTARSTGDLDNFITGTCDGLQRADPRTPWQHVPAWTAPENLDIAPSTFAVIADDALVVAVVARKTLADTPGYDVEIVQEERPQWP